MPYIYLKSGRSIKYTGFKNDNKIEQIVCDFLNNDFNFSYRFDCFKALNHLCGCYYEVMIDKEILKKLHMTKLDGTIANLRDELLRKMSGNFMEVSK